MITERANKAWHAYYDKAFNLPIPYIVASHGDISKWHSNIGELIAVDVKTDKLSLTVKVTEPGKHYIIVSDGDEKPILAENIDFSGKNTRTFGILHD